MSENTDVKFGEWIDRGFKLYQANFVLLILTGLIALLVSTFTVGVLAGPMMIGLALVTLRLIDGSDPVPSAGDIFQGFGKFVDSFLYVLVLGLGLIIMNIVLGFIPCIGSIAAIFVSYAVLALVMFAPFRIADADRAFWPACQDSIDVVKANFWPFLGLYVVSAIIGSLGAILCGIGMFLTLPITICILAVAYRDVFNGGGEEADVVEPVADDSNAPTSAETQATVEPPADEETPEA